jgi:hypothetical protein
VSSIQLANSSAQTALNFAAGFFGVPAEGQYNLEIQVEAAGVNNSGASYETCPNSNNARGSLGTYAAGNFTAKAYQSTVSRLQPYLSGAFSLFHDYRVRAEPRPRLQPDDHRHQRHVRALAFS